MVSDFIFDGRSLSEFGYMILLDNASENIMVSNMEYATIQGARNDALQRAGYKYPDTYTATFTVIKDLCKDDDNEYLTNDDVSELTRWLARKEYKWFRFIETEESSDEIWYKAMFKVSKEYVGDRCYGLKLEMHTNAPYGFTKKYTYKFTKLPFKIASNSDEEGYIYPDFEFILKESGDLEITNYEEQRVTILKNCIAGEVIRFYGQDFQQIESTNEHDYVTEFNYKFPRLVTQYTKNDNNFIVNLDCEVLCSFRSIRKVGLK